MTAVFVCLWLVEVEVDVDVDVDVDVHHHIIISSYHHIIIIMFMFMFMFIIVIIIIIINNCIPFWLGRFLIQTPLVCSLPQTPTLLHMATGSSSWTTVSTTTVRGWGRLLVSSHKVNAMPKQQNMFFCCLAAKGW